jgi:hypothetical protein
VVRVPRPSPVRALQPADRETVLAHLHAERFQDRSPAAVYATLLDEGEYHCSIRTMYRLLEEHGEVRERRDQLTHPAYQKPELMATAPNQSGSATCGRRQMKQQRRPYRAEKSSLEAISCQQRSTLG